LCCLCDNVRTCYNFTMKKIFLAFADPEKVSAAPMSAARRARYEQLLDPDMKRQYAASSVATDAALCALTGGHEAALTFVYDENGAPKVAGAYVSPTHTKMLAACAACDVPAGLDMEDMHRKLSGAMLARFGSLDGWLALEACVKMTGEGLAAGRNKYILRGNEIFDRDGKFFAYAGFGERDGCRYCVCCREKFEIIIV